MANSRELGFAVRGRLRPGLSRAAQEAFTTRFLAQLEANALWFGGGIGQGFDGFVSRDPRTSATEADRALFAAFLAGDADVVEHEVGALVDAWH